MLLLKSVSYLMYKLCWTTRTSWKKNNKIVIEFLLRDNFAQMEWKPEDFCSLCVHICDHVHIFTLSLRHCFVPPDKFSDIYFSWHILNIIIVFSSYKGIFSTVYTDAERKTMPSTLQNKLFDCCLTLHKKLS